MLDETTENARMTPLDKAPDPDIPDTIIAKERYTDPDFMRLEWDRLWSRVWLLGCMEQDLPEPGDYVVTEIGRESILIVRQPDRGLRAFYNVCQHRGNLLRPSGAGHAASFQCAYHHWEYHLDGRFKHIPDAETFPQGTPCTGLEELPCEAWAGLVFFSLNPDVGPLAEYLGEIPEHLDPYNLPRMARERNVTVEWDCNWKTSVDAFNESYHVQGIHPQLLWHLDDLNIQIDCYERHNRYLIKFAKLSPRVNQPPDIPPGIKGLMKDAGMDPADYYGRVKDVRADLQAWKRQNGTAHGKDYSRLHDAQLTDDFHYLIFPNITLNMHADDYWLFRQRPHATDPNRMYFDIWTFKLIPEGEEWPEPPEHQQFHHGEKSIGLVLDQDAANLPGVQRGMNSAGYRGLWLGKQELRIRHFHKVIDDYIYGPEGKPDGAL
ncbi:aromatic ring-hydroxylating oxygenase subunit alpha [Elongatibacter sediminis]|uniref:Aromatic ring-hydroxylating dioxygenase subunit alpha n=1 Tax=Elongatibacter sediminis TaxID=3119006 RepID=A0AAW9RBL5_9GAMM